MRTTRVKVVGVVLAAGRGRRLGGPKALLAQPLDGRDLPLAEAHARAWSFCDRVLIVTRADIAADLASISPDSQAELVVSEEDDELGPAGSLTAASRLIEEDALVVLTPVDCPPTAPDTVQALIAALREDPHRVAARPRFGTRRGHPVALRPLVWTGYRNASRPLRDVLREWGPRVADVAVDDAGVLRDIDTVAELGAEPRFITPLGRE